MRLPKAIKEEDARELMVFMRSKYKYFRETYKYLSAVDPQKEIMCISMNTLGAFAQEIPRFVDMRTIKLSDVDLECISTNAGGRPEKMNPANQIIRHQFMEVWIRLCFQKYVKNQYAGPDINIQTGMSMLFQEFLQPTFKAYDSHEWRKKYLWVEEIDYVLKLALPSLKLVFKKFTAKKKSAGASNKMISVIEFVNMINEVNCFNERFGSNQLSVCFNLAMMT